jgi:hypothetical protein
MPALHDAGTRPGARNHPRPGGGVHVRSDAVNFANLHIDQLKMDAVGRLVGHSYTRIRDQFDRVTPCTGAVARWRCASFSPRIDRRRMASGY